MKCRYCQEFACGGKYENRTNCAASTENFPCTCCCQVTVAELLSGLSLSIISGLVIHAVGAALFSENDHVLAKMSGAALIMAGFGPLIITPVQKMIADEHLTLKGSAIDAAFLAATGTCEQKYFNQHLNLSYNFVGVTFAQIKRMSTNFAKEASDDYMKKNIPLAAWGVIGKLAIIVMTCIL